MEDELAERFQQGAFLPESIGVALEHHMHRADALREPRVLHGGRIEYRREITTRRLPRDEADERLARVEHAVAPALLRGWRSGVNLTRRERDDAPRRMDVLAATEERERGAALDDAEDVLVVRVRSEPLTCVPRAQQLDGLEHAHARHRRRLGADRAVGHRLRVGSGWHRPKLTRWPGVLHTSNRERTRPATRACYSCTISRCRQRRA